MFELNRGEKRALWLATVIVLLGAAARLGLAPDETLFGWSEPPPDAAPPADGGSALDAVRQEVGDGVARAARASTPLAVGERIDPNEAPAEELDRLPGVGPATARSILEERASGGAFRSPDDMLRVPGIGPTRLEEMAAHLSLPGGADAADRGRNEMPGDRIDLNRADRASLERLPGIGPALAGRILELRGREGPFRDVEDLLEVSGIGPVTLERLAGRVVVR